MPYSGTYVVNGPPGTGKTTFLTRQVRKICDTVQSHNKDASPVAVCSLTRAAAREIASRDLPIPEFQVGTLHSMAYRQLGSPEVAELHTDDFNQINEMIAVRSEKQTVDDLNTDQISSAVDTEHPGTKWYQEYSLLRAKCTPRDAWPPDVQFFATQWEDWKRKNDLIDFTDMIEHAIDGGYGHAPGTPRIIIVDESQDMSTLEWKLINRWKAAAEATIIAGDPYQELYGWRGADASIFFDETVPESHRKLLHRSHRVPLVVRDVSMNWLRMNLLDFVEIQYSPRDERGELAVVNAHYQNCRPIVQRIEEIMSESPDDTIMIAGTCGYMVAPIIKELRSRGIPFSNPWRRKRGDWNPLRVGRGTPVHYKLTMLRNTLFGSFRPTYEDVHSMIGMLKAKGVLRRGAKKFYTDMTDQCPNRNPEWSDIVGAFTEDAWGELTRITENAENRDKALMDWVYQNANQQATTTMRYAVEVMRWNGVEAVQREPRVFVGTCHSFKGAQADHVFLIPDLSPSADHAYQSFDKEAHNSVVRTIYVGMTRARKTLTFCAARSPRSVRIYA